jgi:PhnB protein
MIMRRHRGVRAIGSNVECGSHIFAEVVAMHHIPQGYHTATPYLIISGAAEAIEFYKKCFGAEEIMRLDGPNGRIGHCEIKIGDSVIMLADESPEVGAQSPTTVGGTPVSIMLYLSDVDAVVKKSVDAGATLTHAVEDKFYGDRAGGFTDPFGHKWYIATHIKDVSPEEMQAAAAAMAAKQKEKV